MKSKLDPVQALASLILMLGDLTVSEREKLGRRVLREFDKFMKQRRQSVKCDACGKLLKDDPESEVSAALDNYCHGCGRIVCIRCAARSGRIRYHTNFRDHLRKKR